MSPPTDSILSISLLPDIPASIKILPFEVWMRVELPSLPLERTEIFMLPLFPQPVFAAYIIKNILSTQIVIDPHFVRFLIFCERIALNFIGIAHNT